MADLARGSSHISSTLSEATRETAITEVTTGFVTAYGRHDLLVFVELLAGALDERRNPAAAAALRERFAVRRPARQHRVAAAA
ncbi:hypothetical protein AB4Y45_34845 [Paraburkholderia sp. EG287A]|uniref:hypothetical protein n=1 Tax=Paraburkholderia sp. EG287A TaxID=3237012 RepID=UPI0034D38DF1